MIELKKVYYENAALTMERMEDEVIDLTVTSPPYDGLRVYNGYSFDFEAIARGLWRVTKWGGVIVWVVSDQTKDGTESGTSFLQALYFKSLGFNLHDTMIYEKVGLTMNHNRYEQEFEYMFVFSKGKPNTFNPIMVPCRFPETNRTGKYSETDEINRKAYSGKKRKPVQSTKIKGNIWRYAVGKNHSTKDAIAFKHPAIFPEKLVRDHLLSWSNEGDLVYDPFAGSGTTPKVAQVLNRRWVASEISEEYKPIIDERLRTLENTLF